MLMQLITTDPIGFLSVSDTTSTVSSITMFIKGSNPLNIPVTLRPPLSCRASRLSRYLG
jgi:hypothetical protein